MMKSNSRTGARHAVGARTAPTADRSSGHSLLRRWLLRLTLLALVGVGIASQRHALLAGVGSLSRLSPAWFAVAILAEVISFAALAEVQRRLLAAGGIRIGLGTMLLLGYASGAMSASLPAGSALGTGYTYRQLTKRGAAPALAARSIVATGTLAGASLAFLGLIGAQLWGVGLICSVLGGLIGASVAVGAISLVVAAVWMSRPQIRLEALAKWAAKLAPVTRRLSGRRRPQAPGHVDLSQWSIAPNRGSALLGHGRWAGALALAAVNWLADFAALGIAFFALDLSVPWQTLGFAYVIGQVVTSLPLVPSALGVAEGSMAVALIHAGVRPDHAFAVVLVYRLVTRGTLLPVGWLAWAGLRRRDHLLSVGRLTAAGDTTPEAGIGTTGLPNAAWCPQRVPVLSEPPSPPTPSRTDWPVRGDPGRSGTVQSLQLTLPARLARRSRSPPGHPSARSRAAIGERPRRIDPSTPGWAASRASHRPSVGTTTWPASSRSRVVRHSTSAVPATARYRTQSCGMPLEDGWSFDPPASSSSPAYLPPTS